MIPVSVFAGRKVAVFGLGGSGLASASALLAGGADVIGWDDDANSVIKATSAGIPTADLREVDWSRLSALVLAPGVPLTHPAPHWSAALARAAGVEVIGDIELFCRERRQLAATAPFVAITGTNGKSTTTALTAHLLRSAGLDAQIGGNIGTAILSLEPLDRRPRIRDRVLVLPDRSRADARSVGRYSSQRHRGSHRPSRDVAALRGRERAPRRRGPGGWNRDRGR